jgi:hypothetical protein
VQFGGVIHPMGPGFHLRIVIRFTIIVDVIAAAIVDGAVWIANGATWAVCMLVHELSIFRSKGRVALIEWIVLCIRITVHHIQKANRYGYEAFQLGPVELRQRPHDGRHWCEVYGQVGQD